MIINKSKYIFEYLENENAINLYNTKKERYIQIPAWVLFTIKGEDISIDNYSYSFENDVLTVTAEASSEKIGKTSFAFTLLDETVEVSFKAEALEDFAVNTMEYFRKGTHGLYMVDCIRRFAPAPRNNDGVNRAFQNIFCNCSSNAFFAPPPLNFCVGNRAGWVAFGLLDLPDSYEYRLTDKMSILVEQRGGYITTKKGDVYSAPRLLLSFPETDWGSISLFRDELGKRNLLPEKREIPSWWKKPLLVTYGDQMMDLQYNWYSDEDWGCDAFTTDWLRMWLDRAEGILGENDFTIVIDAFWQHKYSTDAKVDEKRFSDLRSFIDDCHARGHKVLLWSAPLLDNPDNGFETLSQKLGVMSPDSPLTGITAGKHYVDFTADNISDYFDELSRKFFGSDPDALDCDGLKMDFLASIRNPLREDLHYLNSENGIGIKEIYRFYDEFQKAAVKVKSDVLLNGSGCDPRFENLMAMNRLHDIQNVYEERELRARASVLACPNLLVDSDGAIMLTDWVKETYIKAVVYSTPSLYYVNKFHDGIRLSDDEMKSLSALLDLSSKKTDGVPTYNEKGDWELLSDNGRVTAHTFGGDSIFVYDGNETMYIFSWNGGTVELDIHDYEFENLPNGFTAAEGRLTANMEGGKVYGLKVNI